MHDLDHAYVLHTHNFTDSKMIAEFFTRSFGRVKTVARNPSKKNRSQFQPFALLSIGVRGHSELKNLLHCEAAAGGRQSVSLRGESLFCAMYVNELVQRLTLLEEPDAELFDTYEITLEQLSQTDVSELREAILRRFELKLLASLGYQINFLELATGEPVEVTGHYRFDAASGFEAIDAEEGVDALPGHAILAVGRGEFVINGALRVAKKITRAALLPHLGQRPLKSRELFR